MMKTLTSRARIVRIEEVHAVRLPFGRKMLHVHLDGWGWARFMTRTNTVSRLFWGPTSVAVLVPAGSFLKVKLWSPTGLPRQRHFVEGSLKNEPAPVRAPKGLVVPHLTLSVPRIHVPVKDLAPNE